MPAKVITSCITDRLWKGYVLTYLSELQARLISQGTISHPPLEAKSSLISAAAPNNYFPSSQIDQQIWYSVFPLWEASGCLSASSMGYNTLWQEAIVIHHHI